MPVSSNPAQCRDSAVDMTSLGDQVIPLIAAHGVEAKPLKAWTGDSAKNLRAMDDTAKRASRKAENSNLNGTGRLPNGASSADRRDDYKPPLLLTSYMKLTLFCLRITCSNYFQNFITFVILVASLLVGIQTYPSLEDNVVLNIADQIILYIFTLECILKLLAVGLSPWEYVYDSEGWNFWNIFDFIVVLVCYLPLDASMVTVIRLFRLLRVLKLVRTLPELQILVMGLLGSVYSIFYVALLLCLVYYLYGIMCLSFFQENDPVNFHDLQTTFLTLFRMSTLDDWTDIMYSQMYGNDVVACDNYRSHRCTTPTRQPWLASLFFVSFIVLSAFVVLNLFIGVVAQQMEEAKDTLTKENENRGFMAGCEDEFDEDERSAKLIYLRYADLIEECGVVQAEASYIIEKIESLLNRVEISRSRFYSFNPSQGGEPSQRTVKFETGSPPDSEDGGDSGMNSTIPTAEPDRIPPAHQSEEEAKLQEVVTLPGGVIELDESPVSELATQYVLVKQQFDSDVKWLESVAHPTNGDHASSSK